MRSIVVTSALLMSLASPLAASAQEKIPAEFRADILELMKFTGTQGMTQNVSDNIARQMSAALHKANPNLPERADVIIDELTEKHFGTMAQAQYDAQLIPIYAKHFTPQEVHDLVTFYQSPIGKKLVAEMRPLLQESVQEMKTWAQGRLPGYQQELLKRLQDEGIMTA